MLAGGWGGATGSEAGGASVINVSSATCSVAGKPALELLDKAGAVIATGYPAKPGDPAVLPPGAVSAVIAVWSNWCDDNPPATPLSLRLSLPAAGLTLRADVVDWMAGVGGSESSSLPRCDTPGAPSKIGAPEPFSAPQPPDPTQPGIDDSACAVADLRAFLGSWGAAAGTSYAPIVVFNLGSVGCVLDGDPPIEVRDAAGKSFPHRGPSTSSGPVNVPAGMAVISYLGFADWCLPKPTLPLAFDLRIAGDRLPVMPTSKLSAIGTPSCQSDPPSGSVDLFLNDPLALPDV
jgi:hypothetical protein